MAAWPSSHNDRRKEEPTGGGRGICSKITMHAVGISQITLLKSYEHFSVFDLHTAIQSNGCCVCVCAGKDSMS